MRGAARIRHGVRRLKGQLSRPPGAPSPATALDDALLAGAISNDRPSPAKLCETFRSPHDTAELAAIAGLPAADIGLRQIAADALGGRAPYFDRHIEGALPPDWLAVPEGERWPLLPTECFDHADFTKYGDLRLLWELGRLQAAPTLLAASMVGARGESIDLALRLIYDFREKNPVGWGPHWLAGLEAGLRIFSLLWTWALHATKNDETTLLLAASLVENGRFVERHLSIKSVSNNHLIGEVAALYCLGCAMPQLADAARWRDRGRSILDRELRAQVLSDGVQGERAIEYHRFVLEFYLQAILWGRAGDENLELVWGDKLRAMLRPLAALTGPDGHLVSLGDDDGGRVVRFDNRPRRDARALLSAGTRLLGAPDLGLVAGEPDGEALWLIGSAGTAGMSGPLPEVESFPVAGWFSSRFGDPAGEAGLPGGHLVFRAGSMGQGGAGHSHVDQLAMTLTLAGNPVFIDGGTYLYNGPQRWRDHFRGAGAHSLVRLGGVDPAIPLAPPDRFGWAEKADAHCEASHAGRVARYWDAVREGDRAPSGRRQTVARRILQIPPGFVILLDDLPAPQADADFGTESLPVELLWLCAPGMEPRWQPSAETAIEGPQGRGSGGSCAVPGMNFHALRLKHRERTALLAHFFVPEGLYPFHREGNNDPPAGWYSEDYGIRVATAQTGFAGRGEGDMLLLSLLADPGSYPRLERSHLEIGPEGDFRLEISKELDETLKISFRRRGETAVAQVNWVDGLEIESSLAMATLGSGGRLRSLFAVQARRISYRGRNLLAEADAESGLFFEKEWS